MKGPWRLLGRLPCRWPIALPSTPCTCWSDDRSDWAESRLRWIVLTGPFSDLWPAIARRMVEDVGVCPGDLVLIRDHAGDPSILEQVMLAVEERGGAPLPENTSPTYLRQLLQRADPSLLDTWDTRRTELVRAADRIIKLVGDRA